MDIYFITGFLGSGKTSFLKNFIRTFSGQKVQLIINEFGKIGIDGSLLKELKAELSEINNGSIFCVCRLDKFEETLESIKNSDLDVIIVETSGLSDPSGARKLMESQKYENFNYKGCVSLVDGKNFLKVLPSAVVARKQILASSLGIVNKIDLISEEELMHIKSELMNINPSISLVETSFGAWNNEWLNLIRPSGFEEENSSKDISLQKANVGISSKITLESLKGFLTLMADYSYRIKGFLELGGKPHLVNCVGNYIDIQEYFGEIQELNTLIFLAGGNLSLRKGIKEAKKYYGDYIEKVEY